MKPKRLIGTAASLLMILPATAKDGLPLKIDQQLQQLTNQHQQVQLQIQQQRLTNELAQLQLDYAKLRREQAQVSGTGLTSSAEVNNSDSELVSEVRFNNVRLSLFRHQQQWRWQRTDTHTGEQSR